MISDFHTHNPNADNAIINAEPHNFAPLPGKFYSVGIHPWSNQCTLTDVKRLVALSSHPQVVAIGEAGIDLAKSALPLDEQRRLLIFHALLAERRKLPLIIHCVRASHIIAELLKELKPSVPWIIHGFRYNAAVAASLLRFPCVKLSFGEHFNPEALRATPAHRRLAETDCSLLSIAEILTLHACALTPPHP